VDGLSNDLSSCDFRGDWNVASDYQLEKVQTKTDLFYYIDIRNFGDSVSNYVVCNAFFCNGDRWSSSKLTFHRKEMRTIDIIFTMIAYLPVVAIIVGVLSILIYVYLRITKKSKCNILLIVGCIGIGIFLLIVSALFLAGALGLGPTPT